MQRLAALLLMFGSVLHWGAAGEAPDVLDPFAWLHPVVSLDAAAWSRLDRGEVLVRVLPAHDGEIGVFAASRLNAEPETLGLWVAAIADLKQSPYVLAVRRFSNPPVSEDLDTLTLDDADLESARRCTPGDCEVKMAAADMEALRLAASTGAAQWKSVVQQQFRHIVLDRVMAYEANGFAGLPAYADRRKAVDPKDAFAVLLGHAPYLRSDAMSGLTAGTESFFYWSKEQYGIGKPVVTVTHVDVVRSHVPGALRLAVVSTEILATHYRNASVGLTAVVEDSSAQRYLVYVNRSQLDVLGGFFGGLKRAIVERRLENDSVEIFEAVRRRLESGPPPAD